MNAHVETVDRARRRAVVGLVLGLLMLGVPGVVLATIPGRGFIEICKSAAGPGVTGTFEFTVAGVTVPVPVGACSAPVEVPAGTVTVTEEFQPGLVVAGISASPSARLISRDLAARSVTVAVVEGDASTQTVVTFANTMEWGQLKVCKVAGPGVALGTNFVFMVADRAVNVLAGPAPGGYCATAGTFLVGTGVTVAETVPSGLQVTDIAVSPPDRATGSPNLAAGRVAVAIGTGVTEVVFTNATAPPAITPTTLPGGPTTTTPPGGGILPVTSTTAPPGLLPTTTPPGGGPTTTTPPSGATTTTPPGGGPTTTTPPGGGILPVTSTTAPPGLLPSTTAPPGLLPTTTAPPGILPTTTAPPGILAVTTTVPTGGPATTTPPCVGATTTVPGGGPPPTTPPGGSPTSTVPGSGATTTTPPCVGPGADTPPSGGPAGGGRTTSVLALTGATAWGLLPWATLAALAGLALVLMARREPMVPGFAGLPSMALSQAGPRTQRRPRTPRPVEPAPAPPIPVVDDALDDFAELELVLADLPPDTPDVPSPGGGKALPTGLFHRRPGRGGAFVSPRRAPVSVGRRGRRRPAPWSRPLARGR